MLWSLYFNSTIIFFFIVLIVWVINRARHKVYPKKLDKISSTLNVILSAVHIPMSFFGSLLTMGSEGLLYATNQFYRVLIHIGVATSFICIIGVGLSIVFRKIGRSKLSFFIQFAPIIIFVLDIVLISFID